MSAGVISAILLGLAALLTSIYGVYTQIRDRGLSVRKQKGDIEQQDSAIKLDDTTRTRLAAEAAQINSDERIATERWWKEQFDAVKTELVQEQRARRKLSRWAADHQKWDQRAWQLALQTDPDCPPPPQLENGDAS